MLREENAKLRSVCGVDPWLIKSIVDDCLITNGASGSYLFDYKDFERRFCATLARAKIQTEPDV